MSNTKMTTPRRLMAAGALAASVVGGIALTPGAAHATVPDGAEKTLVIVEQSAAQANSVTPAIAKQRVFTGSDSANAWFKEVSGGRVSLVGDKNADGDVVGTVTLTGNPGKCNTSEFLKQGRAAAQAQGYNPSAYMHTIVYVSPDLDCGGGMGSVGGNSGWVVVPTYAETQMLTHEIGHNFGNAHSGATTCKDATGKVVSMAPGADKYVPNGGPTPDANGNGGCSTSTYADPYSTMGNRAAHWYTASQLAAIGWITPSQVTTAAKTGTFTLNPMEDSTAATRAIKIPVGSYHGVSLWIEHRQSTGQYDQFGKDAVTSGVTIRMGNTGSMTHLLNMHPGGSFNNSQLNVGETFQYNQSISVKLVSLSADGVATVRVEYAPYYTTAQALPAATVGTAYSQAITATGGGKPYTWHITEGALPPGLTLGGASGGTITLSGTPTTAGTYTFKLRVRDAAGIGAWRNFTVTVN